MAIQIFFWKIENNERCSELLVMAITLIQKNMLHFFGGYQALKISHQVYNVQNNWKYTAHLGFW